MKHEKLIIIGSGPAGYTAGIYAARAGLNPLMIAGNQPGGQLVGTSYVENWPGEKSILGAKLMQNMKDHALAQGMRFVETLVDTVDFSKKPFHLHTQDGQDFSTDTVILCMGATPKKLNVPGEQDYWGKGVTSCAVCDAAFYPDKKVVIVGGGDTAMEDAHFLKKFTNKITVVHILDAFTASDVLQKKVINDPDINIVYNTTVTEIKGDGTKVTQVVLTNQNTKEQTTIDADGVFIAIGLKPTTGLIKGQVELDQWGYVKVHNGTATSVPGVFAAGDIHDFTYRQAIVAAGSGCMAALDAVRYLAQ